MNSREHFGILNSYNIHINIYHICFCCNRWACGFEIEIKKQNKNKWLIEQTSKYEMELVFFSLSIYFHTFWHLYRMSSIKTKRNENKKNFKPYKAHTYINKMFIRSKGTLVFSTLFAYLLLEVSTLTFLPVAM